MPKQQTTSTWKVGTSTMGRQSNPLAIAEPQHRILNRGEENISIQQFPTSKSSAQQIKDICLHYVKKCSGQYVQNKASARYIHQMADEVLNQISGLISQINRIESEPEAYQLLLQEFKECFPSNVTSPRQVAQRLTTLQEDYDHLVEVLEKQKVTHQQELITVASSVNEQIKAYKDGILKERRHNKSKIDDVSQEYNQKLVEEKLQISHEKKEMEHQFMNQMQSLENHYITEIQQLQSKYKLLEQQYEASKSTIEDLEDDNKEKATEIFTLRQRLSRMEFDEDQLSVGSKTPRSLYGMESSRYGEGTINDGDSVKSYLLDDDDDMKSIGTTYSASIPIPPIPASTVESVALAAEVVDGSSCYNLPSNSSSATEGVGDTTDGGVKGIKSSPRISKQSQHHHHESSSGSGDSGSSGRVNSSHQKLPSSRDSRGQYVRMAKSFKKKLLTAQEEKKEIERQVVELSVEIQTLKDNNKLMASELRDAIELNKELKRALLSKYKIDQAKEKITTITPAPHPLCHTPHFLGKADKMLLNKNPRHHILTGVNNAGRF